MSYSWYRFQQPPMYPHHLHYTADVAHQVPQAVQAATQAASAAPIASTAPASGAVNSAMHTAQSAFSHPPHLPPSYPPQPQPYYEFGRAYRRGCYRSGPRLFPLLLLGGFGVWTLHRVRSLEEKERARSWRDSGMSSSIAQVPTVEESARPQRSGWGRRRGDQESSTMNEKRV